jgi:hypothetical protein
MMKMSRKTANTKTIENIDTNSLIEELLEHLKSDQIVIPNPEEVSDYLRQYPDIIDLVEFACDETRDRFTPPTQLSLELYRDPESDDEYLTLYVRQEKYEEDIMDVIEDVWSTYEHELTTKLGDFLITTDFDFPR